MENVLLIVLLLLALALTVVILVQRSEGGGLGMGGGGGVVSGRSAANAMTKLTWLLGAAFMAVSLAMTVIAAQKSASRSVIDQIGAEPPARTAPGTPAPADLLPPPAGGAPLTPPRAD